MIITIWRHGQAGSALSDRERELTSTGVDDIGFGAHQFGGLCEEQGVATPGLVLFSRWKRTAQTADIVAQGLGGIAHYPSEALVPGSNTGRVDQALTELCAATNCPEHVVLVSHQPLVTRLVDHYLGERGRVPSLSPGALAVLTMDIPAAACARLLCWSMPPEYEVGR